MRFLPSPSSPRRVWRDMADFLRDQRGGWKLMLASILSTGALLWAVDEKFGRAPEYRPPEITYVGQWREDRSREEIVWQQAKDKPAQDAKLAAEREAALERQRQFKRVGAVMGLDTGER